MSGSELIAWPEGVQRVADLLQAKGHPHAVFQLTPADLEKLTHAPVADFSVDRHEEQGATRRAMVLVASRTRIHWPIGEILSPCISVCRMSAATGLCEGCFRTRDEIAAWGNAGDDGKRATWDRIEQRMAALQSV